MFLYKEAWEIDDVFLLLEMDWQRLSNVTHFDFSDCINLDMTSFIDVVTLIKCVKVLKYRNCTQVTQYHLMRLADLCPYLVEVDGSGAGVVSATIVYGILYTLRYLQNFSVEPRKEDIGYWMQIKWQFSRKVSFGLSILSALPEAGDVRSLVNKLEDKITKCTGACRIVKHK